MQLVLAVCLCLLAGTAHSMCSPSLCSDCESSGECSTNSCTWMTTGNLGPRCESSPGQPADQSVSVEGKCSGNTDSNQNVNCASGDGTNVQHPQQGFQRRRDYPGAVLRSATDWRIVFLY